MKPQTEHGTGLAAALGAFGIWGFLPLYFYLIGPRVNAWEVLAHRIIWATLVLAVYALLSGRLGRLAAVFRKRNMWLPLAASALCIGTNWIVFIWAVTHNHVLETSLGYYITPLLNVLMGVLFLSERLRPLPPPALYTATLWCPPCAEAGSRVILWEKPGDGAARGAEAGELEHGTH